MSSNLGRARGILAVVCMLSAGSAFAAYTIPADTLFYGGDYAQDNGLYSTDGTLGSGTTYQNFVVPAGVTWQIAEVFGFYGTNVTPDSTASWEIRSGLSSGDSGTLIASNSAVPAVVTSTGGTTSWGWSEYGIEVPSLDVTLGPGTYWVGLRASTLGGKALLETTSGENATGIPLGYVSAPYFADDPEYYFAPSTDVYPTLTNFSIGVAGSSYAPEPAGAAMVLVSGLILFRRRRQETPPARTVDGASKMNGLRR